MQREFQLRGGMWLKVEEMNIHFVKNPFKDRVTGELNVLGVPANFWSDIALMLNDAYDKGCEDTESRINEKARDFFESIGIDI